MKDRDEMTITPSTIAPLPEDDPAEIRERIRLARKAEAREQEAVVLMAQIGLSPRCARNEPMVCRDVLAYHEPCSKCGCPAFLAEREASS